MPDSRSGVLTTRRARAAATAIQRALDNVVAGRTTIAIAHRLSTLRKADLLLVTKDGRLAERGTHAELLALDGEHARLQRAQASTTPATETEAGET